jgi:hypothetical protein
MESGVNEYATDKRIRGLLSVYPFREASVDAESKPFS